MHFSRVAILLVGFSVAVGCSGGLPSPIPDGGTGDGGRVLLRTVTCEGDTGDGAHRVFHQVLRYSNGSATSSCSVRGVEGVAESSASYYYGQEGQPGGDCFLELSGTWWRVTLAQDEENTIVTEKHFWLVPCRVSEG